MGNHHFPVIPLYTDDNEVDAAWERSYSSPLHEYVSVQSESQSQSYTDASQPSQPSQSRPQSHQPSKSLIQRSTLPFVKTVVVADTSSVSSQSKVAKAKPVWSTIAYYEVIIVSQPVSTL